MRKQSTALEESAQDIRRRTFISELQLWQILLVLSSNMAALSSSSGRWKRNGNLKEREDPLM